MTDMADITGAREVLEDLYKLLYSLDELLDPQSDIPRDIAVAMVRDAARIVAEEAVDRDNVELLEAVRMIRDGAWKAYSETKLARRASFKEV